MENYMRAKSIYTLETNIIPKYRFVASLRLKSNFQLTKERERVYNIYIRYGIIKQITKKQGEYQSKSVTYVCNIHIRYVYTIQPNIYPVALTLVCLTSSYIYARHKRWVSEGRLGGFCIAGLIETQTTFLITNPTFSSPILAKSCRMYIYIYMESQRCMNVHS